MAKEINNTLLSEIRKYIHSHEKLFRSFQPNLDEGLRTANNINSFRMNLAMENFTEETKCALFEVLFFLHVNDPKFTNYEFTPYNDPTEKGNSDKKHNACLYIPNCMAGVLGVNDLNPIIKKDFLLYCYRNFGYKGLPEYKYYSIVSVCSIGSVGTIAHKSGKSDLDIQLQYELYPPNLPSAFINRSSIKQAVNNIFNKLGESVGQEEGEITNSQVKAQILKRYPVISKYLDSNDDDFVQLCSTNPHLIESLIIELDSLYQVYIIHKNRTLYVQRETLFQKKAKLLEEYLQVKFPNSEIFFFAYSTENYRKGKHGNTKKSKEASGSAYELILNYEVLLPGIHFNSVVPSHNVFNLKTNDNLRLYKILMVLIKSNFGLNQIFKLQNHLVDLGNTPALDRQYIVSHFGSVYWESFKASQGNLPKAFLNLLRIETMLWHDNAETVIRAIKDQSLFNTRPIRDKEEEDEFGLNIPENKLFTLSDFAEAEEKFVNLCYDPWWIRYKILKCSYEDAPGIITLKERYQITSVIDICFAIHLMLSEVMKDEMDNAFKEGSLSYRRSFLTYFYNNAFPPFSENRQRINNIFLGNIDTINNFEKELKELFHNCIKRVEFNCKINPDKFAANREEFNIWHHYFKKYFIPPKNMIPRGLFKQNVNYGNRINVHYKDKQWIFYFYLESKAKNPKTFLVSKNNEKQHEVELFRHQSIMYGFAYCVLNGYFKADLDSELRRASSSIEVNTDNFQELDKTSAKLLAESGQLMAQFIIEKFRPFYVDYRDCLNDDQSIKDACIFVNVLIFGRLDILYRDKLDNWYYYGYTCDSIRSNSKFLHTHQDEFFQNKELLSVISKFCENHKIPTEQFEEKLYIWLNPISLHSIERNTDLKLTELKTKLMSALQNHVLSPAPE